MTRPAFPPRRAVAALAVVVGTLLVLVPATHVLGQTDTADTPATAIVSQEGWWNRAQGPQSGEPPTAVRPAIGGVVPAPSTVPGNGLAVGSLLGDPDKVAAIGIVLEAPLDPVVERLVLSLKERTGEGANGANANVDNAKIVACPIDTFWGGTKNGDWVNRPTCDEALGVTGKRAPDGTWTFDLKSMASQWLSTTEPMDQNGVLLVEAVEAPQSFQVSFGDMSTNTIKLDFAATGLNFSGSYDFTFDDTFADEPVDTSTSFEESFEPSTGDSGVTFDAGDPSLVTPGLPAGEATAVTESSDAGGGTTSGRAIPTGSVRPAKLLGNLPLAAVVFLVLLILGAALLLGLVLGPLATPSPAGRRAGGVSRALAQREATEGRA